MAYPYHQTVMLQESLEGLFIQPEGIYVDLTFGGGGHSQAILQQLKGGKLFAFDQDQDAMHSAHCIENKAFTLINANFRLIEKVLTAYQITQVDGIIAGLGVSSHQLETASRGFSTRFNAPLDMRMDQQGDVLAKKVLNNYSIDQLAQCFKTYGEVRRAYTLAKAIGVARTNQPIETVDELKTILKKFSPPGKEYKYYAQVFQALRIEVNDELEALKEMLIQSATILKKKGRLVVLAYHSLEDRLVKNLMNKGNCEGVLQKDLYGNLIRPLKPLYRKPIIPSKEEIQRNNRARSAKLRVGEKI
ncbi:MAG: 16S rRNA (cytosine(1402)-N(4))-methyltransferase RsmH [Cytophagales bacterium]|nr:16S rRNA (cytosine(1402)-N(4))-methyltransferase RsmH [Cytophagales bacterium]